MQTTFGADVNRHSVERSYASFWRRAGASMVDTLMIGIVFSMVMPAVLPDSVAALYLLPIAATWIYIVGMTAGGATLGKRAVGIKVTDNAGYSPGVGRALKRGALPFGLEVVPMALVVGAVVLVPDSVGLWILVGVCAALAAFVIGMVDVLWMVCDEKKQTIHDQIADTIVVHTANR